MNSERIKVLVVEDDRVAFERPVNNGNFPFFISPCGKAGKGKNGLQDK